MVVPRMEGQERPLIVDAPNEVLLHGRRNHPRRVRSFPG
jgi:hypothetical protein